MALAPDVRVIGSLTAEGIGNRDPIGVPFHRLYRRLGDRYVHAWAAFGCLAAVPFPFTAAAFLAWFTSVDLHQFFELVALGSGIVVLAVAASFVAVWRETIGIHRWLRAGKPAQDSAAVRAAAVRLPSRAVVGALVVGLPLCLPASWMIGQIVHYGLLGDTIVCIGGFVSAVWAGVLAYFTGELFMQPILWDTAVRLPREQVTAVRRVSLGKKLFGAMVAIGLLTSTGSAMLSAHHGNLERLAVGLGISIAITTVVSSALTTLVVRCALAPIHHLRSVTELVREGELAVRAHPVSADELADLSDSLNAMLDGLRDRQVLHAAFGSYVDPEVADRILSEGQVLPARSVDATILFVDIRDFTAWSEGVEPADAVARLDSFFAVIVPIVERHQGRVNKFVGDGLVAVFGLLSDPEGAADLALRAAVEIAETVLECFGGALRVGIGLNSGPIVAGSVGGGGRLEYMLIGDPVNVASRVERLTRATGDTILLTEETSARLTRRPDGLARRGEISVKGKSRPLRVYGLTP